MRRKVVASCFEALIVAVGAVVNALIPEWWLWIWVGVICATAVVLVLALTKADQRVPWRLRIERQHSAGRDPLVGRRAAESREGYVQADADFRAFWYDLHAGIARIFTPKAYRSQLTKDADESSKEPPEPIDTPPPVG